MRRIHLLPVTLDDVDDIMEYINDPGVTRNFASTGTITREQEESWLKGILESRTDILFVVRDLEGNHLGMAGIHRIYWPAKNGRLGIILRKEAQGRGLGGEVLDALLFQGFEKMNLHKLWVMHFSSNTRMAHMLEARGFVTEGVLRDEYFHENSFHDMVRTSLLKPEWMP